ncbi:MAG TPA: hypothetical protein VG815_04840 [Chloroflexota bacterium]|jgi:hypothetical protein|nr:hypothetical protein [Chloroflexota bacterium]
MTKGDATFDRGNDYHRSAGGKAREVRASRCKSPTSTPFPSIAVTPRRNLFVLTKMVPGDRAGAHVTVKVTGTDADRVMFSARKLLTRTCPQNHLRCPAGVGRGNLARALKLTVFDLTTGLKVYSDNLKELPFMPSFRVVCAAGSTSVTGRKCHRPWDAGERHTFSITVIFPVSRSGDNAYQGTGVAVQLLWSRT